MPRSKTRRSLLVLCLLCLGVSQLVSSDAAAFSQSSPATPMGHEFVTVASALELLAQPPPTKALLIKDKGSNVVSAVSTWLAAHVPHAEAMSQWSATYRPAFHKLLNDGHRKMLMASSKTDDWPRDERGGYGARYYNIWSATMGQRWVDLGGFNVVRSTKCWEAITQMGDAQQPDHFLRRRNDIGQPGAIAAIEAAKANFKKYFVEAVLADPQDKETIVFRDGGVEVTKALAARKAYFLFGRAAHLFQDSFSAEHGVRDPANHFQTLLDIKSYVCTLNSPGHTHDKPTNGHHGDVIWNQDIGALSHDMSAKNMKPYAVIAMLAMEELWATFLWARATPQDHKKMAESLADQMAAKWMSYDPKKVGRTPGINIHDQVQCDKDVGMPAIATTDHARCLKLITNLLPEKDKQIGLSYSWAWTADLKK